eukprot:706877-Pyramimonas_sp.AAC.1
MPQSWTHPPRSDLCPNQCIQSRGLTRLCRRTLTGGGQRDKTASDVAFAAAEVGENVAEFAAKQYCQQLKPGRPLVTQLEPSQWEIRPCRSPLLSFQGN